MITYEINSRSPPAESGNVYANTEGVYRTREVGPVNIEGEYNANNAPILIPNSMPQGARNLFTNRGPVVEADTIKGGLNLKSTYK